MGCSWPSWQRRLSELISEPRTVRHLTRSLELPSGAFEVLVPTAPTRGLLRWGRAVSRRGHFCGQRRGFRKHRGRSATITGRGWGGVDRGRLGAR
eukprot:12563502-Alexandrium_andersonii.AAC.1